jgi:hypothetical protein
MGHRKAENKKKAVLTEIVNYSRHKAGGFVRKAQAAFRRFWQVEAD